jgi:membrane protein DedA with SNARE-associated domain
MWLYLVVFLSALAVDLIPVAGPPAWTVMVFLLMKFDLNPWGVLAAGVPGSALGRFLLSLYIPKVSSKFLKRRKNEELEFVGKKLAPNNWRTWLFVFVYTLMPLPTTALFTAAGLAKVKPTHIVIPFFLGKFISDAVMIFTGRYAAASAGELLHGAGSIKSIATAAAGLIAIAGLLFVDWRVLLEKKKFKFNFKIWK